MATVLAMIVLMYVILTGISVLLYFFNSMGLYKIAKREEDKNSYIAWIPCLNRITESKIAFNTSVLGIVMVVLQILSIILMLITLFSTNIDLYILIIISCISFVLSSISKIIDFVARYKIYNKYSKSPIIMTTLDIISFGILGPIFVFAIKDNNLRTVENP